MKNKKIFINKINSLLKSLQILEDDKYIDQINKISEIIIKSFKKKGKLIICGNGGSASQSDHISAEIVGKFLRNKKRHANSLSLNSNNAIITSLSNDYSYDDLFARQLKSCAFKNDTILLLSTSGKSKNIIRCIKESKKRKIKSILITGIKNKTKKANVTVNLPAERTDKIQELQLIFCHILCEILEAQYFCKK